jgi:predicted CXXCH cytochrome family protein
MEFAIGSGHQGKSYAWRHGDSLFQSPIAWYREQRRWDMAPGYEQDPSPDFYRPITAECLFCHAGGARPVAGTQNRYLDPPFAPAAISCERCHGDASTHLAKPGRATIVNPARLPPAKRNSVCEACHLSGEARIPNPGKDFRDFRPGMQLEEVFSVYVANHAGKQDLKVVSHFEQLAASRCATESQDRMWCGSCHDPHREPAARERAAYYRDKCLICHEDAANAHRQQKGDDCTGCHMPRKQAYDGGHTAFTDHWIRRTKSELATGHEAELRAWREPAAPLRKRNLALAYIASSEKAQAQEQLALARLQKGVLLLNEVLASGVRDGAVAQAAGLQFLKQGKAGEAVRWFRLAAAAQPADSLRRMNLAASLLAFGDRHSARAEALEAIRLEPLLEEAYALLAEIEAHRASYWKAEYRKRVPNRILP